MRVLVRFRPPQDTDSANDAYVHEVSGGNLSFEYAGTKQDLEFEKVLDTNGKQDDLFESINPDIVRDLLRGFSSTVWAYGPTSAGKSYSLFGSPSAKDEAQHGIVYRCAEHLFSIISGDDRDSTHTVTCSYVEIFRERFRDLLAPESDDALYVRESATQGVHVDGLVRREVEVPADVADAYRFGEKFRGLAGVDGQTLAARSHTVFSINVEVVDKEEAGYKAVLAFVDVAGCEKHGGAAGKTASPSVDAKSYTASLSALEGCIEAKAQGRQYVPYREGKLTRLMRESLGGSARSILVVCCSPSMPEASLGALRLGSQARSVQEAPVASVFRSREELERMVALLTQEVTEHSPDTPAPMSAAETRLTLERETAHVKAQLEKMADTVTRLRSSEADARGQAAQRLAEKQLAEKQTRNVIAEKDIAVSQHKACRAEADAAADKAAAAEADLSGLQATVEEMERNAEQMRTELSDCAAERDRIVLFFDNNCADLAAKEKELDVLKEMSVALQETTQSREQELGNARRELQETKMALSALRGGAADDGLESAEISILKKQMDKIKREGSGARIALTWRNVYLKKVNMKLKQKLTAAESVSAEVTELKDRLADFQTTLAESETQVQAANAQIISLLYKLDHEQAGKASLQANVQRSGDRLRQVLQDLSEMTTQNAKLRGLNKELFAAKSALAGKLSRAEMERDLEAEKQAAEKKNLMQKSRRRALPQAGDGAKEKELRAELETLNTDFVAQLARSDAESKALASQLERASKEAEASENERVRVTEELAEVSAKLATAEDSLKTATAEQREMKAALAAAKAEAETSAREMRGEAAVLRNSLTECKQDLHESRAQCAELEGHVFVQDEAIAQFDLKRAEDGAALRVELESKVRVAESRVLEKEEEVQHWRKSADEIQEANKDEIAGLKAELYRKGAEARNAHSAQADAEKQLAAEKERLQHLQKEFETQKNDNAKALAQLKADKEISVVNAKADSEITSAGIRAENARLSNKVTSLQAENSSLKGSCRMLKEETKRLSSLLQLNRAQLLTATRKQRSRDDQAEKEKAAETAVSAASPETPAPAGVGDSSPVKDRISALKERIHKSHGEQSRDMVSTLLGDFLKSKSKSEIHAMASKIREEQRKE